MGMILEIQIVIFDLQSFWYEWFWFKINLFFDDLAFTEVKIKIIVAILTNGIFEF